MDFTQMMTLLIISQRHFMHGPSNVYRVIWDCIGVILTPCSLFYLTDICQTLIDKFDRCQGPKTVRESQCAGLRAAQRLFNVLPFFFCIVFLINIILYHLLVYTIPYPVLAILTGYGPTLDVAPGCWVSFESSRDVGPSDTHQP